MMFHLQKENKRNSVKPNFNVEFRANSLTIMMQILLIQRRHTGSTLFTMNHFWNISLNKTDTPIF